MLARDWPPTIRRQPLYTGGFVALFDPRRLRLGPLTVAAYFAASHVVVSYNGDLRGIVEDVLGRPRTIRCSVPDFANLGAIVEGSALLATVPAMVAEQIRATRPRLRVAPLPFTLRGAPVELLWPAATDDDAAGQFIREQIRAIAGATRPPGRKAPG
ncbi:MAG: hypothetical protein R2939_04425 [Kofleriaceae bacterium]